MRETEMAVVISQEQNEIAYFQKWGKDIKPHREKMRKARTGLTKNIKTARILCA